MSSRRRLGRRIHCAAQHRTHSRQRSRNRCTARGKGKDDPHVLRGCFCYSRHTLTHSRRAHGWKLGIRLIRVPTLKARLGALVVWLCFSPPSQGGRRALRMTGKGGGLGVSTAGRAEDLVGLVCFGDGKRGGGGSGGGETFLFGQRRFARRLLLRWPGGPCCSRVDGSGVAIPSSERSAVSRW